MNKLKIFTDGGARGNPGPAAAGVSIEGLAGKQRLLCGKYLGETTNNIAEYSAVLLAYETVLKEVKPEETEIEFFQDSLLVVKQLNGEFKIKNPAISLLVDKVRSYQEKFALVTYTHIRREFNKWADSEVNRVLDNK